MARRAIRSLTNGSTERKDAELAAHAAGCVRCGASGVVVFAIAHVVQPPRREQQSRREVESRLAQEAAARHAAEARVAELEALLRAGARQRRGPAARYAGVSRRPGRSACLSPYVV